MPARRLSPTSRASSPESARSDDTATAIGTITVGYSQTTETAQDTAGYVGMVGSITVDKQISVDGCTWLDVGAGNVSNSPTLASGKTLYERVIVVNDTGETLNNGQVSDTGSGPSGFTFGGGGCSPPSSTFTLGAGQTIVSNVASFTATIGTQYDTATATGTITVGSSKTTETAQDDASYIGTVVSNGKITGTVWNDSNDDGQIDCGDTTRGGVTVELLNNGGSVVATTTTNGSGNYSFGSLAGGTYNVESRRTGWAFLRRAGPAMPDRAALRRRSPSPAARPQPISMRGWCPCPPPPPTW